MSEKPRNSAKNPTQISSSSARAGNSCWETQNPSRISSTPVIMPSHQAGLMSRDEIEAAAEDEQQPEDRGQRPERAERARERPAGGKQEQDRHQHVRPAPPRPDRGDEQLTEPAAQEHHAHQH